MTNNEEYNNLYEKYKSMTNEQLQEIINSCEEYRDIAKQVEKDIHFIKNAMMFFVIITIIGLFGLILLNKLINPYNIY